MYTLHIGNKNYSSWSLRPWLMMKELNIAFKEEMHFFSNSNSEKFRKFSPSGKVPCLVSDGMTVWDSLAIAEFLAELHPAVWPTDKAARAWARCAAAEMHSGFTNLREMCSMNCAITVELKERPAGLKKEIARLEELWGEGLKKFGGPFLAGNKFTAVDAFFSPVVLRNRAYNIFSSKEVLKYCDKILALPSLQAWIKAGIAEPVDQEHEDDCTKYGKIKKDVRK